MKSFNIFKEKWMKNFVDNFIIHDAVTQCNEVLIPINKSALAMMLSSVFKAIFQVDMEKKKSNMIVFEDFDEEAIK